jgi:hypothetical protein
VVWAKRAPLRGKYPPHTKLRRPEDFRECETGCRLFELKQNAEVQDSMCRVHFRHS